MEKLELMACQRTSLQISKFYRKWGIDWIRKYYEGKFRPPEQKCRYNDICRDYDNHRYECNQYEGSKTRCIRPNFLDVV